LRGARMESNGRTARRTGRERLVMSVRRARRVRTARRVRMARVED
jgi:hypothetical protein